MQPVVIPGTIRINRTAAWDYIITVRNKETLAPINISGWLFAAGMVPTDGGALVGMTAAIHDAATGRLKLSQTKVQAAGAAATDYHVEILYKPTSESDPFELGTTAAVVKAGIGVPFT